QREELNGGEVQRVPRVDVGVRDRVLDAGDVEHDPELRVEHAADVELEGEAAAAGGPAVVGPRAAEADAAAHGQAAAVGTGRRGRRWWRIAVAARLAVVLRLCGRLRADQRERRDD